HDAVGVAGAGGTLDGIATEAARGHAVPADVGRVPGALGNWIARVDAIGGSAYLAARDGALPPVPVGPVEGPVSVVDAAPLTVTITLRGAGRALVAAGCHCRGSQHHGDQHLTPDRD